MTRSEERRLPQATAPAEPTIGEASAPVGGPTSKAPRPGGSTSRGGENLRWLLRPTAASIDLGEGEIRVRRFAATSHRCRTGIASGIAFPTLMEPGHNRG